MEPETNKTKKKSIIVILLAGLLLAGIFLSLALYYSAAKDRAYLASQLRAVNMELSIRSIASSIRLERENASEAAYKSEKELRASLQQQLLERDAEELAMIVNPWNALPEDYTPRLVDIGDDKLIDERCAGALDAMLTACKEASYSNAPVPISAYRTQEYQQELYDNKIDRVIASGYSAEEAPAVAAQSVAVPGTSEHQLCLAIDIIDEFYTDLDSGQEWTSTQRWLMSNCYDYGFILRYPNGTTDITGIIYEPWHYRYVGRTVAKEIEELGVTYEEYLELKGVDFNKAES